MDQFSPHVRIGLVGTNMFVLYADSKDADQHAHMRRLISVFVNYFLEQI